MINKIFKVRAPYRFFLSRYTSMIISKNYAVGKMSHTRIYVTKLPSVNNLNKQMNTALNARERPQERAGGQ